MTQMFRSLGSYNYRVWMLGALVSNIGGWMQTTAQDWVVLTQLTHNDATAMGVTMALQSVPPLLLVSVSGWVADRVARRKILYATQLGQMLLAVVSGTLLLTGMMTLPIMLAIALITGVTSAFDMPARQAFVSDVVRRENASNAVALNAASFNAARLIGPAVGGLLVVTIGTGWVFILNAATFVGMLVALSIMRVADLVPQPRNATKGGLADGFRYVVRRRDLLVTFVMIFLFSAFGMNFPIFASTMAVEFDRGADGFGVLTSLLAAGSLVGALLAARRDRARLRVITIGLAGFGLTTLLSAAMPDFLLYASLLLFVGLFTATILTTANGYVQTTTDPALRGRVLAVYMAVLMGSTPVGAPVAGWIATNWGPRAAIVGGAIATLVACAIGVSWWLFAARPRSLSDHPDATTSGN